MYGNNDPEHERLMEEHDRERERFISECEKRRVSSTTPQQRKWVGLTDDEVTICHTRAVLSMKYDGKDPSFTTLLYRQIEAKLKEKNQ